MQEEKEGMWIIANLSIDSFAFLLKSLGVVSTVFALGL